MRNLLIMTGFLLALTPTAAWSFDGGRDTGSSNYWMAEPPRNLAPEEEIASPAEMREAPTVEPPAAPPVAAPLPPPPIQDVPSGGAPDLESAQGEPEPFLTAPPTLGAPSYGEPSHQGTPALNLAPTGETAGGGEAPQLPPMP